MMEAQQTAISRSLCNTEHAVGRKDHKKSREFWHYNQITGINDKTKTYMQSANTSGKGQLTPYARQSAKEKEKYKA